MSVKRTRLSPSARIDQLLDVAKQMILSDGLQAFTMESLARTAAVSSPLVYNYFSSRQALLQALLEREYKITGNALFSDVMSANSFEEVIRMFVANNFDHHAPGNIVPVLLSQPEIAAIIKPLRKEERVRTAHYLVENTAKSFNLTIEQAQFAITMSSGASIAAAEWAAMNKLERNHAIGMIVSYIKSGMAGLVNPSP
ncbi:MAG: TetR/AcrR family transcriptional regulator [Burkholderiales bacterium]|jgi:AcrR family transcriptional regulator|nr:TetR/AcrR family transcriptional regulator [Gammaproteobacteria bacterium]MDG1225110.1 TetR/AcrR family transcriptional regulator [Burkholderiales bacterium]|tara:strand:+ start:500 stop:1093 length:594 start_codon:yes stop_codon:yes gene_type:complete